MGGAAGTGLGLARAPSRVLVTGDRCAGLNGSRAMPGLQAAGCRAALSGYAGLEVCWLPEATGLSGTPGLWGRLCAESRLVVVGAKVDSVPS